MDAAIPKPSSSKISIFHRFGKYIIEVIEFWGSFGFLTAQTFKSALTTPFYFRLLLEQMYTIGVRSFLLIAVTGLTSGTVMALQFSYGLKKFGASLYIPKVVSLAMLREMGPVFACLMVAGRVGSGIAAEVASMKVTQQIDAIRALGTSPIRRIVVPRVLACMITIPILTMFADYIGLMGAMVVADAEMNMGYGFFISKALETVRLPDLFTGMIKSLVFAFFISMSACLKGLQTEGGTQGVGNTTTWVVVTSSIFIMVSDAFLTKLFIITKIYPS